MHNACLSINANMRLHAEVPLVAFFGLMHFRITLTASIFGRRRRSNDGGVNNSAFLEDQALCGQQGVDGFEDALGQLVCFQQAAKFEQGSGVRCGFSRQVNANKSPDGLAVIDGVFNAFVRESKALLGDVHAQHPLYANRRSAPACSFRVERLDLRDQGGPWRHFADFVKKPVAPSDLLLCRVFQFGKACLRLHVTTHVQCADVRRSGGFGPAVRE